MTPAKMRRLADLLLPGDAAGLPAGSQVAAVMAALASSTSPIKAMAASKLDFSDPQKAKDALVTIEHAYAAEFRDFALSLIKPYYESAEVLEAMGWRSAPPQPQGHQVAPMDPALAPALARVAQRKRLWR